VDTQIVARIDLARLADTLAAQGREPELVHAIGKAAAAGSIREDLRNALACLKLIEQILDRSPDQCGPYASDHEETAVTGALFTQAVILYARATATKGGRPKLLGEAKLTSTERATHDDAMKMRDSAIAHFGRGESLLDGPIVREAVLLSLYRSATGPKKRIGVYTVRAQHKVGFAARLIALVVTRLAQLEERYQRLFNEADQALEMAVRQDPALGRSLPGFEFDAEAFCGSPEAATRLRAQLEAGTAEDMAYGIVVPKP
jgi:hypothetical protein